MIYNSYTEIGYLWANNIKSALYRYFLPLSSEEMASNYVPMNE